MEEVRNGHAHIAGDDARHLTKVLRVEAGQRYEISDNRNVYLAEIETARKQDVVFRTLEKLAPEPARVAVTVCASLIKFDHFELMVEKATELGVDAIQPVIATRSERGLDRAAHKRLARWQRIALEASQQCRRAHLPEVHEPLPFAKVVTQAATRRFALDENLTGPPLARALPPDRSVDDTVALLIGPEGGWADPEREQFTAAGWQPVSVGPLVLRAETAAIAALSIITGSWV